MKKKYSSLEEELDDEEFKRLKREETASQFGQRFEETNEDDEN